MATTTTTRTTNRHSSAVSAARQGWHKWVAKNWGWFVPVLAVVGLARGGAKTVKWSAPKIGRAGRWAAQHPIRFVRWSATYAKAAFADGLDAVADLLDRHDKTRGAADKIRAFTGRTGMTCGYCGAQLRVDTAEAHMDAHNGEFKRQEHLVTDGGRPKVVPIRPRPAPAAAPAVPPARPAPAPTTSTTPAGATSNTAGGKTMTATGTSETQQLMRAANALGDMDPDDAWELDAQLVGLQRAALVLTENLGQYVETLDRIKTDPRVTANAGVAVGQVAEMVKTFATTRALFRQLYAAQFAAAEAKVRVINRPGFFDPSRAA